jgi:hypothetical protein
MKLNLTNPVWCAKWRGFDFLGAEILNIFFQSAAFNLRSVSDFEGVPQRNILDNEKGE